MITEGIIIALLGLLGTLIGSYLSNRKNNALVAYRLEQVEKTVAKLDTTAELRRLSERVTALEAKAGI